MASYYIELAMTLTATVYGLHNPAKGIKEYTCGDYSKPQPCKYGAVTATGVTFDPSIPMAAVPMSRNRILRKGHNICVVTYAGDKLYIPVLDKANERWVGNRGFDLTPAAVEAITGKPATPYWSGKLNFCEET